MNDMDINYIVGDHQEAQLIAHDGTQRTVYYNNTEAPYPEGRLIVSSTDLNGIITHVNQSFVSMSGYEESELVGQPHAVLRHPEMPAAAFKDLWDTVQAGNRWQGYVKNLRKDGAYYWVYASVIPNIRAGVTLGYTSVRRKPSREKIAECIALYSTL